MTEPLVQGNSDSAGHLVQSFEELVSLVDLERLETYELRVRRRDGGFDDVVPGDEVADENLLQGKVASKFLSLINLTETHLSVRVQSSFENLDALVEVDMAAIYRTSENIDLDETIVEQFVSKVAMMTIFPYIRQQVSDLTGRANQPLTLPLLRAGSLQATAEPEEG